MKKVIEKVKELAKNRAVRCSMICGAVASLVMCFACAEGETTATDLTSAVSSVSTGIGSLASTMLTMVGTIASAALPVIACVLIWKFGMKIFKKLTGQAG